MIVCDNIVFELQRSGGISKHWAKTIERLDRSGLDISYIEAPSARENIFRKTLRLENKITTDSGPLLFRRLGVTRSPGRIFHSSYYRISKLAQNNVVTIHDFMNEYFPKSFRDPILVRLKRRALDSADRIIVVSECTKRDLLKYYRGIDPGIVHVIYNGVDDEFNCETHTTSFSVCSRQIEPKSYFLYVGTRGYCKNFPFVLRFFGEALRQGLDAQLVIVGGGELEKAEQQVLAAMNINDERILQFQEVESDDLRRLYSNTIALLIPSLYEGFGIPALEAARCGALVLAADGSALTEIVGESDYLIDLKRPGEISRILSLGFDNASAEAERNRLLQRSFMFDWDRSVAQLQDVYNSLL